MVNSLCGQRGMSLVSLMVASLIGLFIIGAALQMYSNSQQTFKARQAISAAAENSRFAIADMRRMIVMAGRGMEGSGANDKNIHTTFTTRAGSVLNLTDGGTTGSDAIHFRMAQGQDCLGSKISRKKNSKGIWVGTVTRIRFFVQPNADGIGELMCQVNDDPAQPLVSGIELLKFLYGVDTTDDNSANEYLTAAEINAKLGANPSIWEEIVSVRVGVVASSAEFIIPGGRRIIGTAPNISVLQGVYTPPDNARSYRSSTGTVALRNLKLQ